MPGTHYTSSTSSGALRVVNPEQLGDLAALEVAPTKSGYLHVGACPELSEWVANSSAQAVNWDEVQITRLCGTVREINHYYPYGLQLMGIDNEGKSYPYKYGSKELQQDEWARQMVLGGDFINLDWLDFEARRYDPTIARLVLSAAEAWYNPDPAEQFMNPYLAMGNSPTMYVDPNGEIAWFVPIIIGAAMGGFSQGMASVAAGENFLDGAWKGALIGGAAGFAVAGATAALAGTSLSAGITASTGFGSIVGGGAAGGFVNGGFSSAINGGSFLDGAGRGALTGAIGAGLGTLGGSIESFAGQVGVGIGAGSLGGSLSAIINGSNVGRGALLGGAVGGVFAAVTSPQLRNAMNKCGFRSNSKLFNEFVEVGDYQGALNYFGLKGTYAPESEWFEGFFRNAGAVTDPYTGEIFYNTPAFQSYHHLRSVSFKENHGSNAVLAGKIKTQDDVIMEEINGFDHVYRNQGFYPKLSYSPRNYRNSYIEKLHLTNMH